MPGSKTRKESVPNADGLRFGAELMTREDKVFTGCAVESNVPGLSSSAEQTAVLKAVSDGCSQDFLGIVLACDEGLDSSVMLPNGASRTTTISGRVW